MISWQPSSQQTLPSTHWGSSPQRHWPEAQVVPRVPHIRPHAPQCTGSVGKLAHTPSQHDWPLGHGVSGPHPGSTHVPSRQICSPVQSGTHAKPVSAASTPGASSPTPMSGVPVSVRAASTRVPVSSRTVPEAQPIARSPVAMNPTTPRKEAEAGAEEDGRVEREVMAFEVCRKGTGRAYQLLRHSARTSCF